MFKYNQEMEEDILRLAKRRGLKYQTLIDNGAIYFRDESVLSQFVEDNKEVVKYIELLYEEDTRITRRYYIPSLTYDKEIIMFIAYLGKNDYKMKYKNVTINDTDKVLGLYQLDYTSPDIYVCEGVFDYLRLKEHNLNAVALLGTSMSFKVSNILKRFDNIYLVIDDDEAGNIGANKIKMSLLTSNVYTREYNFGFSTEVRYKDIDDVLKEHTVKDIKFN